MNTVESTESSLTNKKAERKALNQEKAINDYNISNVKGSFVPGSGQQSDQFETMPAKSGDENRSTQNPPAATTNPELSSELSRRMMESKGLVRDAKVAVSGSDALKPEHPTEKPLLLDQSRPTGPESKIADPQENAGPVAGDLMGKTEGSTGNRTGFDEHTTPENRNPAQLVDQELKPIGPDINQMMEGVQVGGLDGRTPDGALGVNPNNRSEGGIGENPGEGLVSLGKSYQERDPLAKTVKTIDEAAKAWIAGAGLTKAVAPGVSFSPVAQGITVAATAWLAGRTANVDLEWGKDSEKTESEEPSTDVENSDGVSGGGDSEDSEEMSLEEKQSQPANNDTQSSSEMSVEPEPSDGGVTNEDAAGGVPDTEQGDPDNPEGALSGKEKKELMDKLLGGLDEHEMSVKFQTKFGGAIDPADESSGGVASGSTEAVDPTPLVAIYEESGAKIDESNAAENITAEGENRQSWKYDNSPEQ
jgi:hypothetical protein